MKETKRWVAKRTKRRASGPGWREKAGFALVNLPLPPQQFDTALIVALSSGVGSSPCRRASVGAEAAAGIVEMLRHHHFGSEIDDAPRERLGIRQWQHRRHANASRHARRLHFRQRLPARSSGGAFGSNACRTSSLSVGIDIFTRIESKRRQHVEIAHHQRARVWISRRG